MKKEQELYDKFVEALIDTVETEATTKDLYLVIKFLETQNIQASPEKHQGLNSLNNKVSDLPFDEDDELPLRRIK